LGCCRLLSASRRRALERERHGAGADATAESLERFCERVADLRDPDVMRAAWS